MRLVDGSTPISWVRSEISPRRLSNLARWHGLAGIVLSHLKECLDESDVIFKELKILCYQLAIRDAIRQQQVTECVNALNADNVNYVVFKGLAAKAQFYESSDSTIRSSADIDLLVHPGDFLNLVEILLKNEYRCVDCDNPRDVASYAMHSSEKLCKRGLVFSHPNQQFSNVDVHWRIANTFSLPLSTSDVLDRKHKLRVGSADIFTPCFEHHFVLCAIHGYLDHFYQLKHLVDLNVSMRRTNFDKLEILSLAEGLGVAKQVEDSMRLAAAMFTDYGHLERKSSSYVQKTIKRFEKYKGFTPRAHKSKGRWNTWDKLAYIYKQTRTRSRNSGLFDPLKNRFLVKFDQVPTAPSQN